MDMRKRVGGRGGARFKILSRRLALAAAGSLGLALPAHAQHYSSIVGFGDSYVDTGNAVRADPRFSPLIRRAVSAAGPIMSTR